MIVRAKNENLSDVIRDLKKFTAKSIYKAIEENPKESRRGWMLRVLKHEGNIWFWEEGYHGEEIFDVPFYDSKVNYIHLNPVVLSLKRSETQHFSPVNLQIDEIESIWPQRKASALCCGFFVAFRIRQKLHLNLALNNCPLSYAKQDNGLCSCKSSDLPGLGKNLL